MLSLVNSVLVNDVMRLVAACPLQHKILTGNNVKISCKRCIWPT